METERPGKHITRREALKASVLFGGGVALAACGIEDRQFSGSFAAEQQTPESTATVPIPSETSVPPPTHTPAPTEIPTERPAPSPTECPPWVIGGKEVDFLANHEVHFGDRERRVALMTYDDQGEKEQIYRILDAFKKYSAKATFFFTGVGFGANGLEQYKDEIKRVVDEGHVFGSHGYAHDPHTTLSDETIRDYFDRWLSLAADIVPNYRVRYFRFPYGDRGDRERRIAAEFGLQSVMWSVESGGVTEDTFTNVVDRVRPGSIVLSHMNRYFDAFLADSILARLKADGYALESVETGLSVADKIPEEFRRKDFCFPGDK